MGAREKERNLRRDQIEKILNNLLIETEGKLYRGVIEKYRGKSFVGMGTTIDAVKTALRKQMWKYECCGRRSREDQ